VKLAAIVLWGGFFFAFYAYALYPVLLSLVALFRKRPVRSADWTPEVTVVVPVYNQAEAIRRKIENLLDLDYPREKMHLIVASDGSTDDTDSVVSSFAANGVRLVRTASREGKEAAQNLAVAEARGEITVFTDATILLGRGALRSIVRSFADPEVGCVSSEDDVPGGGEGLYIRYEMHLRRLESSIGTLVGVSGSFYAVRRELLRPTDPRFTRDFLVPLDVIESGRRVVGDPEARGSFRPADTPGAEFQRKVRTVLRGMDVLLLRARLLNPIRRPFVAWVLWSHKVARWAVPWALLASWGANTALLGSPAYAALFALQTTFYLSGALALVSARWGTLLPGKVAAFFLVTNAAVFVAWIRCVRGERAVIWEPTKR
jgi:cellulose synthase/poly-beta-1,6-N-acetylglucosamine synthase-like glycosyltransferase